jgi:L-iditol 2-dehydrogenase
MKEETTMWAHSLVAPARFERVEVASLTAEDVPAGHVLLRALVGGVCGSDLPAFRGVRHHDPRDTGGFAANVPGLPLHEIVGEVLASNHPKHSIGDRVVGWASRFDGIAQYVISDGEGLVSYDAKFTPTEAITIQPLACVMYAVDLIGAVAGKKVAVLGQGPIGLLFSHVLNNAGATVTGVDRVDRSEVAELFGVTETATTTSGRWANSLEDADRPPVIIEAVGHQVGTLGDATTAIAIGGQITLFGVPDDPIYPLNMQQMYRKSLTVRSGATADRRTWLARANDYLLAHDELRTAYVTSVFPVDKVQQAFEAAILPKPGQFKIALDMIG